MKTPRPCVMIWLAREGTSDEQYAAYDRLIRRVNHPPKRSTIMVGDEPEVVEVDEMISGLPLSERYAEAAVAAAREKGFDRPIFVLAVLFRELTEAPSAEPEEAPLKFIGRFEFPFPERGDHVGRDDQEWLGIDESYVMDEDAEAQTSTDSKPWWKFWR
jgi:hypothetical protein